MMSKDDKHFMMLAIELGEKARLISPPNPWVGAIIVNEEKIVGQGFTSTYGSNHAEINALNEAGKKAENATLYVTLEPCCHHGKTPPCVDALIKAKIGRVVIALKDPDIKVSGKGIEELKKANIPVTVPVCEHEAYASLEPYLHQRSTLRPFVVAKSAISIDGRVAASNGSSKWISNTKSREDAQSLRQYSDAILIGSNTALKDLPTLNIRDLPNPRKPLRVLFDGRGQVMPIGPLFDQSIAKTLIFTSVNCNPVTLDAWKNAGIEVEVISTSNDGKLAIEGALIVLGKRGILQLLIEGGGTLLGSFIKQNYINRLVLYVAPKILGDEGKALFQDFKIDSIENAPTLKLVKCKQIDDCMRLEYKL